MFWGAIDMKKMFVFKVFILFLSSLIYADQKGTSLIPHKYTINLMWVNRKLKKDQKYIYPVHGKLELHKKFLNHIYKWAEVNKKSTVYLWFDSLLTPHKAVKKTKKIISEYIEDRGGKNMAPIILRDVRSLPEVKKHPEVFSDKTPIFYRVDLLRVIAQVHDVSKEVTQNFVYSDLDIEPISKKEIFDVETLHKLEKFGIVMTYHPIWLGFENSFSIVGRNKKLLEAMQYAMIDLNIQRGYNALQGKFYKSNHVSKIMPIVKDNVRGEINNIPMASNNYSINLMCLNHTLKKNQKYIHPGSNKEELEDHFFKQIFEWSFANPQSRINLWFDSKTTTTDAVKNTKLFIKKAHPKISNIVFKDVHSLLSAKNIQAVFGQRANFLSLKKELLEVIVAMEEISSGKESYTVFGALFEVPEYREALGLQQLSREEIFDNQTMDDLQRFGISVRDKLGFRFRIVGGNTEGLFKNLNNNWVKPIVGKVQEQIYGKDCCDTCCVNVAGLQQIIYCSYPGMFAYFYHIAGFGKLKVERYDHLSKQFTTGKYNKEKHGLVPFGLDRYREIDNFKGYKGLSESSRNYIWIPTKEIAHPNPTLMYEDDDPVRHISLNWD